MLLAEADQIKVNNLWNLASPLLLRLAFFEPTDRETLTQPSNLASLCKAPEGNYPFDLKGFEIGNYQATDGTDTYALQIEPSEKAENWHKTHLGSRIRVTPKEKGVALVASSAEKAGLESFFLQNLCNASFCTGDTSLASAWNTTLDEMHGNRSVIEAKASILDPVLKGVVGQYYELVDKFEPTMNQKERETLAFKISELFTADALYQRGAITYSTLDAITNFLPLRE